MGYLLQDVGGSIPAPSAQSSEAAFDSLRVRKVELSPPKLCTKDRAVGQNYDPYTKLKLEGWQPESIWLENLQSE